MKIAILGYDVEGMASYDYFSALDDGTHQVVIHDQDPDKQIPEGAKAHLGPKYLDHLDSYDLLVRTPGMHPDVILKKHPALKDKITTGTNEFLKACPTKNIIGVTGTKGKGTTSTLITKILEAAGNRVFLGGNIGIPALGFISEITENDWVVLELSSFQLVDCQYSPNIAVCLMVVPEHLNWHKDMAEYMEAKQQLFAHQTPADLAVYNASNSNSMDVVRASPAVKAWYQAKPADILIGFERQEDLGFWIDKGRILAAGTDIAGTDEIALLGEHNWENVCAAIAATWEVTGRNVEAIRNVITTFTGLPFRIELRAEKNGIKFYNDSFAATPDAAMAAMDAIPGMKVMIMGGFDRGLDLTHLAQKALASRPEIRGMVIIGAAGPRYAEELDKLGFKTYLVTDAKEMSLVIDKALEIAQPGDSIVLSPGFASFDMFKNFEDRGNQFNAAVEAL